MHQNAIFSEHLQHTSVNINGSVIRSSNCDELLGITIDSYFIFAEHINKLYRKASLKRHALSRISQYLSQHKKWILFKAFITLQFKYCPLVWMCHSKGLSNRMNNIHKRDLRVLHQDKK